MAALRDQSRTPATLKAAGAMADQLAYLVAIQIDEAAAITCQWSRRQLIDVALELAQRDARTVRRRQANAMRSHRERIAREDARWTRDQALKASNSYNNQDDRTQWAREGRRVYDRMRKRESRDEEQQAG